MEVDGRPPKTKMSPVNSDWKTFAFPFEINSISSLSKLPGNKTFSTFLGNHFMYCQKSVKKKLGFWISEIFEGGKQCSNIQKLGVFWVVINYN